MCPGSSGEAKSLANLSHANIVTAFDYGVDGDHAYLVMELIVGQSLAGELAAARTAGAVGLPVARVLDIADQVLEGLSAAHAAGLVHRDLKPANVMVVGAGPKVKIVDFGIAHAVDLSRITATGSLIGTLPYTSPEQINGRPLDGRSDLYSLGCMLHELLTGRSPYEASSDLVSWLAAHQLQPPAHLRDHVEGAPVELDAFITRLLAKDRTDRPASAEAARALLSAIRPAASPPPLELSEPHDPPPPVEPPKDTVRPPVRDPADDVDTVSDERPPVTGKSMPGRRRVRGLVAAVAVLVVIGGVVTAVELQSRSGGGTPTQSLSGGNRTGASGGTGSPVAGAGAPGSQPLVGVILPDATFARYETADRPILAAGFQAAGVRYDIQNAHGDIGRFQEIADSMLAEHVDVLIIDNIETTSGAAVIRKAKAKGVPVIDYDRLTFGGGADYYVTFNNVTVGALMGQGLRTCLTAAGALDPVVAELNGSPSDPNATQFAAGYNSVLDPLYQAGTYAKGPNRSVPEWNPAQAGTIFAQMLSSTPDIKAVLAANDELADAVITVLKQHHRKMPVTGQDATVVGLRHILDGDQCMTVFKGPGIEAKAAIDLAVALAKGQTPAAPDKVEDPVDHAQVSSVLVTAIAITKDNVKDAVTAGGVTKAELCTTAYAAKCAAAGIR